MTFSVRKMPELDSSDCRNQKVGISDRVIPRSLRPRILAGFESCQAAVVLSETPAHLLDCHHGLGMEVAELTQ